MPCAQPGLSMLDALRARSAAARAAESSARSGGVVDPRAIDRALLAAFRWLDEAFAHLDVIRPVVVHRFELPGVLTIASPRYDRGVVSCRRSFSRGFDLIERIELFYRMTRDEPVRVEVPPGAAAAMEDRLRCAQLEFQYRIEHEPGRRTRRGVFTVAQAVMAAIRLVPDYGRGVVAAELRNVDRLEPVTLEFAPAAIDEPALEDLVRLVLGDKNGFFKRAPLAGVGAASRSGSWSAAAALSPSRYRAGSA
jgi:hypothetical protein